MSSKRAHAGVLDPFLEPRSVAIIGLSRKAVDAPVSVLTVLREFGYAGRIYVINPRMTPAGNYAVCACLQDIPECVDLAIVSVARARLPVVVLDCIRNGIRAAIVITQGLADADEEGVRLQGEILALAREGGLRILGPNTIGVANAFSSFTSSFIQIEKDDVPIGQVSQSGLFMMGHHIIDNEPAGFCMAVDLGNACDIGLLDVLEHYAQDQRIRAIQCHTEGITDGRAFVEVASRIARIKPIIALKAAVSNAGGRAAASHTGSAAGDAEIYRAAFLRAGVVPARNAQELRWLSKAFVTYPPPRGGRVAIMSFSGGGAILALDALEGAGLTLATLSHATRATLQEHFPPWMEIDNPVDVWIPVSRDFAKSFPTILELLLRDDGVDAVICIYCAYRLPAYAAYDSAPHIRRLAREHAGKPILCWSYGLDIIGFTREIEKERTAMVFPSLQDAATALAHLVRYGETRSRDASHPATPGFDVDRERVTEILARARRTGQGHLFVDGFEILEAYGLSVARWRIARDQHELLAVASDLAYPVCIKIISSNLVHKSDSGGIRLGISGADQLVASYHELLREVRTRAPGAEVSTVMVQELVPAGKEVMMGAKQDPAFGPCLVAGAGGIYTEVLDDYAFRLAPVCADEVREMMRETKIGSILQGVRGEPPCDMDAVVDSLLRISLLVCNHPEIRELDVNPIIVGQHGAVVVDARVIV